MSGITSGVGLASGIDINALVNAIIGSQQRPLVRIRDRAQGLSEVQAGLKALEAFVLGIKTSSQSLGNKDTVEALATSNTDATQLTVSAGASATLGNHAFRAVRLASTHSSISRGFANSALQTVGAGTLTFSSGGFVSSATRLDLFNGGDGVERGSIRITDRDGNAAEIDLSTAYDLDDVLSAINETSGLNVTARAVGDRLELVDSSVGAGTLSVAEVGSTSTAADLGILASTGGGTLSGSSVFGVTGDFTLDLLNDGNGVRLTEEQTDLRITLTDDSVIDINLDAAASLDDVIAAINDHEDNGGKVLAELSGNGLQLTDLSGGGGSAAFEVSSINGSNVAEVLGLETTAAGGVITGERLLAGLNSVLVRNLNGGTGIDIPGSITIDDRAGNSSTIDLSGADSLDEILEAINTDGTIQVTARINDRGDGILIEDTSGGGGNLTISDVGPGTTAADLGITVDAAQNSVDSGSLGRRHVNEATLLSDFLPPGQALTSSTFTITDSSGASSTLSITANDTTVGDVLQKIGALAGISVTAELNETGDGLVIVDQAGGGGSLNVTSNAGNAAERLGLLSDTFTGGDGKQRVSGRSATVVEIEATDTLTDVAAKINAAGGHVTASVVNSGSAINPFRLQISAAETGRSGRFLIDDTVGLNFDEFGVGNDAILRVGNDNEPGFLVASNTNTFDEVVGGIDVTVKNVGESAAKINISRDTGKLRTAVQSFVTAYNGFIDNVATQTRFNAETGEVGVLNGQASVVRISSRLETLATRRLSGLSGEIRSLADIGVRTTTGGKLTFDTTRFNAVVAENPEAVADFFLTKEDGFGDVAETALDGLTDPFTGTFKIEDESLQNNIDSLANRLDELNELLEVRRQRLLLQFVRQEEAISLLQSQQATLAGISRLQVNPAPTGAA